MNHQLLIPRRRSGFSPLSFGSDLALWLDPSYGVYTDRSTQLTAASSQYWSSASTGFNPYQQSFTVAGWFKLDSKGANRTLVSRYLGGGQDSRWSIFFNNAIDDFRIIFGLGTAKMILNAPSTATWYFIAVKYDNAALTIATSVNGAAWSATTAVTAASNDVANFFIGATDDAGASAFWDGSADSVGYWSRVLTDAELVTLYNAGAGKVYADLTAGELTNLLSWYEFDGDGLDAHGSNDLTAVNTPTYTAGVASATRIGRRRLLSISRGQSPLLPS